jgi:predicted RNA-binding Zn ribbon-like protein
VKKVRMQGRFVENLAVTGASVSLVVSVQGALCCDAGLNKTSRTRILMSNMDFRFDLGRLSLNLVATVGARCSDQPIERLPTPRHLSQWLRESGGIKSEDELPRIDEASLADCIELREVLYRIVHDIMHGHEPAAADISFLNATARGAHPPIPQLVRIRADKKWRALIAEPITLPQIFGIIARDAIDLLGGPERQLMRECAGHICDGVYIDRSRGFRRQWCSSKTCGNQVRVERFRTRAAAK